MYHGEDLKLVFGTYDAANTTTQEYALSRFLQSTWARFAKNPAAGPGWNQIGTGAKGKVLTGAIDQVSGGVYLDRNAVVVKGDWDLAVIGNVGNTMGSGATILPQSDFDQRCRLWTPVYESAVGPSGIPPS